MVGVPRGKVEEKVGRKYHNHSQGQGTPCRMVVKPGEDGFEDAVFGIIGELDFSGVVSAELQDDGIEEGHNEEHVERLVAGLAVAADVVTDKVSWT